MATERSILKSYFLTGKKPTQQQFSALIDSFFHLTENKISVADVGGLSGILGGKSSVAQYNSIIEKLNDLRPEPFSITGQETFLLAWDEEKKTKHGDYGHFEVWMNGSLQQVPISFTTGEDGKPDAYTFILDNIDSLIFII